MDGGENAAVPVCVGDGVVAGAIAGEVVQISCDIDPRENENMSSLLALE